jgi:type I restriction enzyme S subunit
MLEELPKGWIKTTLGEIAEPSRERALPREFPAMRYVGLEHVEPETMKLVGHRHARETRSSSVRFSKGDVLYGKMRPYLNKVWVAEFDGLCSAEFLVFPKREGLNSQFLAIRLNAEDFVTFSNGQISGERPRVNFEKLSGFSILLPPIAEQERIVAKLNAALSRVDRGKTAARRARERVQRYRATVLNAAVTGELTRAWREASGANVESSKSLLRRLLSARRTRWEEAEFKRLRKKTKALKSDKWKARYAEPTRPNTNDLPTLPEGWIWISIDQLSWASSYGTSIKCTYDARGPAVLRIPNIRNGELDFEDLKFAIQSQPFSAENFVAPGDLLLIRTNGSKELIGRAAVIKALPKKKSSFASYLIRFRLTADETIWSWVALAWDSDLLRSGIESRAATTAGQYNVSLSGLADLAVPLPPIAEQEEIIREVGRRLAAADRLTATLDRQLDHARVTRESLLREAITGRLTPQDPKDEPASLLLERIRLSLRAQAQKPKAKPMPKSRPKSKGERSPLLDVLRAHKNPITPEQLFREAGFEPSQVDLFYRELNSLRNTLREQRPNTSDAKLWPHRSNVLLQLKNGAKK